MPRKSQRVAYPLTFLLKKEGDLWASLACEVDVASCGENMEAARQNLMEAVALYVTDVLESEGPGEVARPVPEAGLIEFATDPPGAVHVEYHTLLVSLDVQPPALEFVPSLVRPSNCQPVVSAA